MLKTQRAMWHKDWWAAAPYFWEPAPTSHLQPTKHGKSITRLAADNFNDFVGLSSRRTHFHYSDVCLMYEVNCKRSALPIILASETFTEKRNIKLCLLGFDKCTTKKQSNRDCTRLIINDSQSIIFKIDVSLIAFLNTHYTPWYRKLALNQKDRSVVARWFTRT